MSNMKQAMQWLLEGKKIALKDWDEDEYLELYEGNLVDEDRDMMDLENDEWIIYNQSKREDFEKDLRIHRSLINPDAIQNHLTNLINKWIK